MSAASGRLSSTAVSDTTADMGRVEQEYLDLNKIHPLVSLKYGFHAEYTTGVPKLLELRSFLQKYREPVFATIRRLFRGAGLHRTPRQDAYELFEDLGLLSTAAAGTHCVYLSDRDLEIREGSWSSGS